MPFKIQGKIDGLERALANLANLAKQSTRSKILRKAVNAASRPMLKAAKQLAPVDQGWLKKSLGLRIQTYRSTGTVVAIIGPRSGFQRNKKTGARKKTKFGAKLFANTKQRPTYYAHLVELGTKAHSVARGASVRKRTLQGAKLHPGAKAKPFLRPAFESQKSQAVATMRQVIADGIKAELK